jgi:NAD(P)-dependent dehydrogenase (short-subunit alcohol dehydrogenase family)
MTGPVGRVVVVTGATGMAGRAATRALRDAGATVIAVGSSAQRLQQLALELPGISTEVADLRDEPAVAELADTVRARHGAVDGLVHLVGGYRGGAGFSANNDDDWRFLSAALVDTLRHTTLAFHSDLARSPAGRAVIVSATAAAGPTAGAANYAAAKAAAEAWMLALADSLRSTQSGNPGHPGPQNSAASILVIKALVDDQLRRDYPKRRFPGFTDVDELAARIVGLWSIDAAELNGARIQLAG